MSQEVAAGANFRNAADMVAIGAKINPSSGLKKYSFSEILPEEVIRDRPQTEVRPLPGCRSMHQVVKRSPYMVAARNLSCFCSGCTTDQFDLCVNRSFVNDYDIFTLKASASLEAAIKKEPSKDDEVEAESTFTKVKYPAVDEWIQLRGMKPTKKKREAEEGFWYAKVVPTPVGGATDVFFISCYVQQPAGTYTRGHKVRQIHRDTKENYHWRNIQPLLMNARGHVLF